MNVIYQILHCFGSLVEVSTSYVLLRNKKNSVHVRSQYKRGINMLVFPLFSWTSSLCSARGPGV